MFILETNEATEVLKTFVLTHGLPKTDMALFGIKCPYCGKSDRIRGPVDVADFALETTERGVDEVADVAGLGARGSGAHCHVVEDLSRDEDRRAAEGGVEV